MRLNSPWRHCVRVLQIGVCIGIAGSCCTLVPAGAIGLNETTNASVWACATTAALALVVLKRSQ